MPCVESPRVHGGAEVIVTPHAREFERIAGVESGAYSVRALAQKKGIVVLLKGNPTLISGGSEPVLVGTGGPELASIGTGDVLSGMVGALWARGLDADLRPSPPPTGTASQEPIWPFGEPLRRTS